MTNRNTLVNAHTHLELGWHGAFRPKQPRPFTAWMKRFMKRNGRMREREGQLDKYQAKSVHEGIEALKTAGVTHVGDITFSGLSIEPLLASGLAGVVYIEVLGLEEGVGQFMLNRAIQLIEAYRPQEQNGLRLGLSAHAPYTTLPQTFRDVTRYCLDHNLPLCIHAAESPDEIECVSHGLGPLYNLPIELGGVTHPHVPYQSTIQYLHDLGVLEAKPLLAHAVHVSEHELDLIAKSGSKIAHCPRSNYFLQCGRHPLEKALAKGIPVALGTDSLATSPSLDIREEAAFAHAIHDGYALPSQIDTLLHHHDIF